jgi:transcriptional regulator with XRE-family HTH domain
MQAAVAIRVIRHRSGLTLRELARRAGTSHATLHTYERGTKAPRLDTIERIAAAAGFTVDLQVSPRPDAGAARVAKGRELVDALELAGQFPARHRRRIASPPFGRAPTLPRRP